MLNLMVALALGLQVTRVAVAPAETLVVETRGAGAPVVLVPGLFGAIYGYRGVAARLAGQGRRVIVIEPLAIGGSSRPRSADYSLTAQAGRIAAVLDSLGESRAVIVAHSVASGMVFRLALLRPDLVRGIVSLDGGPSESAATAGFRRAMSFAPILRLFGAGAVRRRIRASLIRSSGDSTWVTDEVLARYTERATADLSATLLAFMAMAESRERIVLIPRLGELRMPVLLLVGEAQHPGRVSDGEVQTLARGLASFALETVPGAGHYLQEERPDVVVDAVERMLSPTIAASVSAARK